MPDAIANAPKTRGRPFEPGHGGGPGRPKGSKNKLAEDFVAALQADFAEHGVTAIQATRSDEPATYLKIIASLLPKDVNITVNDFDGMTDDQLVERIRSLRSALLATIADRAGEAGDGTGPAAQDEPAGEVSAVH